MREETRAGDVTTRPGRAGMGPVPPHRPNPSAAPPADPCLAGAAPRLWPSYGPYSLSLRPSVPFSCRLCQGLLGDPELGRGGVGGFPLHGRTPPCSWPRVASSMGGGQAAGLQTGPWLFIQLSELASVPLPGPGLSGVKMLSPVPTPGSDLSRISLDEASRASRRAEGCGPALSQSPVDSGSPGGGAPLRVDVSSPPAVPAPDKVPVPRQQTALSVWVTGEHGTKEHVWADLRKAAGREFAGVVAKGCVCRGQGSNGPKPLASCQHPPPAEPPVSARGLRASIQASPQGRLQRGTVGLTT